MIVVLKLVANLLEGNNFGVEVKSLTECSKSMLAEAVITFISVDSAKPLITVGELGQFEEVMKWSCRNSTRNTQKHL